ncbi:MAG: DedA family protein, partial [Hyphomicrobiaceae bacterium]
METSSFSHAILEFVKEHRTWAPFLVTALAFCESMAFISLVLPFWTVLIAIGALFNATGSVDFWMIVAAAATGAALGDWLSYWLGYHYHDRIAHMWPLNKFPDLMPKGHAFFE